MGFGVDIEIDVLYGGSHIQVAQHPFRSVTEREHQQPIGTNGGRHGEIVQSRIIFLPLCQVLFQP